MKIGIDISQIVYTGGVAVYVRKLVTQIITTFPDHEYILFGSSLRQRAKLTEFAESFKQYSNVQVVIFPIPLSLLDLLWNRFHICPIEWIIGSVDIFWSSDWTQPPLKRAKGVTTIHDISILKYPQTFAASILHVQKRRLRRVKQECVHVFCDSQTTKSDVQEYLGIENNQITVVYPGL